MNDILGKGFRLSTRSMEENIYSEEKKKVIQKKNLRPISKVLRIDDREHNTSILLNRMTNIQ